MGRSVDLLVTIQSRQMPAWGPAADEASALLWYTKTLRLVSLETGAGRVSGDGRAEPGLDMSAGAAGQMGVRYGRGDWEAGSG